MIGIVSLKNKKQKKLQWPLKSSSNVRFIWHILLCSLLLRQTCWPVHTPLSSLITTLLLDMTHSGLIRIRGWRTFCVCVCVVAKPSSLFHSSHRQISHRISSRSDPCFQEKSHQLSVVFFLLVCSGNSAQERRREGEQRHCRVFHHN